MKKKLIIVSLLLILSATVSADAFSFDSTSAIKGYIYSIQVDKDERYVITISPHEVENIIYETVYDLGGNTKAYGSVVIDANSAHKKEMLAIIMSAELQKRKVYFAFDGTLMHGRNVVKSVRITYN